MWRQRAERARLLAGRYPASREILIFYAGLAEWQGEAALRLHRERGVSPFGLLPAVFPSLLDLVSRTGPQALAQAARELDATHLSKLAEEYWITTENPSTERAQFFVRAALQPYAGSFPVGLDCPRCPQPPQAGCLSPQGEGLAFEIVCALCLRRRPFPRTRCPGCESSDVAVYTTPDFPHLRLQACNACQRYLPIVDLSQDPGAIPEVDELAGLPLDLWALENGFRKLQENLAGI